MRRGAAAGAALVACALLAAPAAAQTLAPSPRAADVVAVDGWSLARLLDDPTMRSLAAAGGAALVPGTRAFPDAVRTDDPATAVRELLAAADAGRVLVVVVSLGDAGSLSPVIVAEGEPATLLAATDAPRALTSVSTRRIGVVTADDVGATVATFLGDPVEVGNPVEPVSAPPPLALERRFLERSRSLVPIGTVAALFATAVGLLSLGVLARGRAPRALARGLAWGAIAVPGLALALLLAGHLPSLTAVVVVPAVLVGTAAVTASGARRGDAAPRAIGWVVLVALAIEAATGWGAAMLPLLGGSQLDGARFYGLPNAFIGLLVGAALFVAWGLPRGIGTAVVGLAAVIAGFPMLGANLGGAVTAAFAAGAWWALRGTATSRTRAAVIGALAAAAGTVVVLAVHAIWPEPTHVQAALRGGDLVATYANRLGIGLTMLRDHPLAIVPALGAPIVLLAALRPPRAFRAGFAAVPGSHEVVTVAAAAGVVAYLANDSGASAAGLTWGLGLALAFWVSLRAMGEAVA